MQFVYQRFRWRPSIATRNEMTRVKGVRRLAFLLPLLALAWQPVFGQYEFEVREYEPHILIADHYDANTFVGPLRSASKQGSAQSARFEVTYSGFTAQARAAFQYAVDIWAQHITSSVPIRINAQWRELGENVLGSAGPPVVLSYEGSWYPPALIHAIIGQYARDGQGNIFASTDINASFSSQMSWYYGTDGNAPPGTFDLVTVVLHEIGHGIGFYGSFRVDDGEEPRCQNEVVGHGCWGLTGGQGQRLPIIFDRFVEDQQGRQLINTQVYPNPSAILGQALRSRNVEFVGPSTDAVADGAAVSLYAPDNFEPASSIAHLDEQTYPAGDINSLMTPRLARAEAIHTPGPIFCAMLEDLGWDLGDGCFLLLSADLVAFDATRVIGVQGVVELGWTTGPDAELVEFAIERKLYDEEWVEVDRIPAISGQREYTYRIDDLMPGQYTFRVRFVRGDDTRGVSSETMVSIPMVDREFIVLGPYPNPASSSAVTTLQVRRSQVVAINVFDMMGRQVMQLHDGRIATNDRLVLDVRVGSLPSGVYMIHFSGEQFTESRSLVVVR
jgi:hypothetical protein